MPTICSYCNYPNEGSGNYCSQCGESLTGTMAIRLTADEIAAIEAAHAEAEREAQEMSGKKIKSSPAIHAPAWVHGPLLAGPVYLDRTRPVTIGRDRINDIVFPALFISRYHAELAHDGTSFVVRDLGSKNGVYVNGDRVDRRLVKDGDRVSVGIFDLYFCERQGDAEIPASFYALLQHISMREIINVLSQNQKTGKLTVLDEENRQYTLYFQNGRIINALSPTSKGVEAAHQTIRLVSGKLRFTTSPVRCQVSIEQSPTELVRAALDLA